ncbi:MAG: winged helix-turn-helix domain-containing protein [Sphingomonadales bacterium]|nr:winged helix-turn-helix domain-containing protein [Sphingomonadales bacterium]
MHSAARENLAAVQEFRRTRVRCDLACRARGGDADGLPGDRRAAQFRRAHRVRAAGSVSSRATVGDSEEGRTELPITQHHLADTIGFSLVHTNKVLQKLRRTGCFNWTNSTFVMRDEDKLAGIAMASDRSSGSDLSCKRPVWLARFARECNIRRHC